MAADPTYLREPTLWTVGHFIKKQRTPTKSNRLASCDCKLPPLSLHTGLKGLQLGKFGKLAVMGV